MGVSTKGAGVELSRDVARRGLSATGGGVDHAASSAKNRPSVVRDNNKQSGKLSRIRRPHRRAKAKHQPHPHKQWHHQQPTLVPAADRIVADSSLEHIASLPFLVYSGHLQHGMERMLSHGSGSSTPNKDDACPAPLYGSMHGNDSGYSASAQQDISQVPAFTRGVDCQDDDYDKEQQLIRKGLEDLLARPPPSLDRVVPDNAIRREQNSTRQRKGDIPSSGSLPELFLPRAGHNDGGGRCDDIPRRGGSSTAPFNEEEPPSSNSAARTTLKSTATNRRTKKPTRSQSGGLPRPANSTAAALSRRRGSAFSAGAGPAKTTTAAACFTGEDAALLEQAFAFAETVAREEEALKKETQTQRRQQGGGSDVTGLQLNPGGKGGRLRRTKSGGGDVAGVGAGEKIETEDWVRGLTRSSPRALSRRRQLIDQQSASINQASSVELSEAGLLADAGRRQANVARRGKLAVGHRKMKEVEEAGALRFDRRREKEGKARAAATVELVERFESGSGVAALRAELKKSQAAMRRSAEAFEQVASRWHHQRSMLPVPGDR